MPFVPTYGVVFCAVAFTLLVAALVAVGTMFGVYRMRQPDVLSFENRKQLAELLPQVYYINLKHRTDRKRNMERQLNAIAYPIDKIHRIDAVYTPNDGALGCALSHLKAFEQAKRDQHRNPYVLILEDDFMWQRSPYTVQETLRQILSTNKGWDVILLACNGTWTGSAVPNLRKVRSCVTTSGYLVKLDYIPKLYALWKQNSATRVQYCGEGRSKRSKICVESNIDQSWKQYQTNDRWYVTYPKLGKQLPSYSDIEKTFTIYNS